MHQAQLTPDDHGGNKVHAEENEKLPLSEEVEDRTKETSRRENMPGFLKEALN